MEVITGKITAPITVLLYGLAGLGKTTLAMLINNVFGADMEGGMNHVEASRSPRLLNSVDIRAACNFVIESDYKTIVFDSATELEKIALTEILAEDGSGKKSLADFPYGRGYELLAAKWADYLAMFAKLNALGKNVVLIAHDEIRRFEDPASDSYDRYQPAIHKKALPLVKAQMDAILFMRYEAHTTARKDGGFSADKKRGVGTGRRIIETSETPAWVAKNRCNLEATLDASPEIWDRLGLN